MENTIQCTFSELVEKIEGLTQDSLIVVSGKADGMCDNHLSDALQDIAKKGVKVSLDLKKVENLVDSDFMDCTALKSVVLPDCNEGAITFSGCTALESVVLPEKLEYVGGSSFDGCTSLKNINIPSGAKRINHWAFWGCVSLEKIELPEGLEKIGSKAFCNCKSLKSLTIPSSVTEIEWAAFCGCEALELTSKSPAFVAENSFLFNADKTVVLCFYGNGKNIAIPDGVTEIAEWAFVGSKTLESVEIPESVTKIGVRAFNHCDNLKLKLNNPNFVAEGNLLLNADKTELISFYGNPKSVKIPEGVTEITSCMFLDCAELENVELPSTLETIRPKSFLNCLSLKNVSFSDGLKEIRPFAFAGCESLKKIEVPASCEVAENAAFYVVDNRAIFAEIVRR